MKPYKVIFHTDLDFIESSSGIEYQVVQIEVDMIGSISVILDTSPIENRIIITKTHIGDAVVEDYRGRVSDLTDKDLVTFLDEIDRAIPPIKSIRAALGAI